MAGLSDERIAEIVRTRMPGHSVVSIAPDASTVDVQADAQAQPIGDLTRPEQHRAFSAFPGDAFEDVGGAASITPSTGDRMVVVEPDMASDAFDGGPGRKSIVISSDGEI